MWSKDEMQGVQVVFASLLSLPGPKEFPLLLESQLNEFFPDRLIQVHQFHGHFEGILRLAQVGLNPLHLSVDTIDKVREIGCFQAHIEI